VRKVMFALAILAMATASQSASASWRRRHGSLFAMRFALSLALAILMLEPAQGAGERYTCEERYTPDCPQSGRSPFVKPSRERPVYYEPGVAPRYHEVTEADIRAIATGPQKALPPLEYDHPFAGRLFVMVGSGQMWMRDLCKQEWPIWLFGCAVVSKNDPWARVLEPDGKADCIVIQATEAFIEARGSTLNLVMRHEIGHCNGWPGDHRGAR